MECALWIVMAFGAGGFAFCAGGCVATVTIAREYNRRVARGEITERPVKDPS